MARRRGHGEGSIHRRKDGSWCAIVDLGWVNGKRKYLITPAIGKHQLTKLTPEQVQAMLNRLIDSGLAPCTVRNVRAVLRDALNQAVKRRRILYNVATLVEIPRAEKPAIAPLTPEQARALLAAVRGDPLEAL